MVVDSSCFVAIVLEEAREAEFIATMIGARSLKISAVTLMETSIVLLSRDGKGRVDAFEALLRRFKFEVVPVDAIQARIAVTAFGRYGKGIHKAGLNFGDCFSYALAKHLGEELLFQGNDFGLTDVGIA